jgi:hypothetical protein
MTGNPNDKNLAFEAGYAGNGLSSFTRSRARGIASNFEPWPIKRTRTPFAMLLEQEDMLGRIKRKLSATVGAQREKLLRDIDAKSNFIIRLRKDCAAS